MIRIGDQIEIPKSEFQSEFLADCIFYFHIFVVLFIVFIPFLNVPPAFLILHITSAICLMLHWYSNSDICSLTIIEGQLRGVDRTKTFTHQFISPVYKITSTEWSNIVWIITFIVMCISIYKLYHTDKFKHALKCYNELSNSEFTFQNTIKCFRPLFILDNHSDIFYEKTR